MADFGIPLGKAFYTALAGLAWQSLTESQQEQIRQFLVLRFVDSDTNALDGCTESRIKERFSLLLKSGQFDKEIDKAISTKVDISEIVEGIYNDSIESFTTSMECKLDERWKKWLREQDGFKQRLTDVVDRILDDQKVEQLITAALYRHLQKDDVKARVSSATANRIQSLLDKWEGNNGTSTTRD